MKLLPVSLFALSLGLSLTACQQDPQSANPVMRPDPTGHGGTTPANPAITYTSSHSTTGHNGTTYNDVMVMDTDGSHQTAVYSVVFTQYGIWFRPTWSASGTSIAFTQSDVATGSRSIVARDVSVVNGVATGSNTRTIYTNSNLYNTPISWSSTTSTNAIAFVTRPTGTYSTNSICRVSASGGTATVLYQSPSGYSGIYRSPTWSNDDSKIAFIDHPGDNNSGIADTIRVIDASTGALLAANAMPLTSSSAWTLDWSRAGMDTLVLGLQGGGSIYYVGPMTGAVSTNTVSGQAPSWSPNNSAIISSATGSPAYFQKTSTFGTSTTTNTSVNAIGFVWKR